MRLKNARRLASLAAFALLLPFRGAYAQQQPKIDPKAIFDYTHTEWFPNVFEPYSAPLVPKQSLSNSQLLHSLIHDGKLELSLEDALALALQNNLDIEVARYGPAYAVTDILRTKSGAAARGVQGAFSSAALFAGAIGGGVGSGAAGGGSGAGGAFGGGGALNVGSVGTFDPVVGVNFGWDRRTTPLGTTVVTGVPFLTSQNSSVSGFYGQRFLTGTSLVMAVSGQRQSSTSLTSLFNPQVTSSETIGLNQPLLKGFGYRSNGEQIRIAKTNLNIADDVFEQQVMSTVSQVVNLYWSLVVYGDNVRVAQQSLALAEKTLADNKKQVQIGTLAPIEVVRAESEVAARQADLIVAQTNLQEQQELLKTAISKQVDAELAGASISPTNNLPHPRPDDIPPLAQALQEAMRNRPEIHQAELNIENQHVVIQANRNALLPTLDAFASYVATGLSGNKLLRSIPFGPVAEVIPGGIGQSFSQTFHNNFPDYSFGLTLQIPLRNRSAQADAARAMLEERQLETQLQKQKNLVAQDVRNAEIAVKQARAQIEAAHKAAILAQQTLDAEQKKFQLGESTVFLVIQAQRDLATAGFNEVQARSAYSKALTQFAQATGTTLSQYNIQLTDALTGKLVRNPRIPGTPSQPQ